MGASAATLRDRLTASSASFPLGGRLAVSGARNGSSSIHASIIVPVTSAWNWIPDACSSIAYAWVHSGLVARVTALAGRSNVYECHWNTDGAGGRARARRRRPPPRSGRPGTSRSRRRVTAGRRRPGARDQLRPEETPAAGRVSSAVEERRLAREPRVTRILIGVHRTAEDDDRVVVGRIVLVAPPAGTSQRSSRWPDPPRRPRRHGRRPTGRASPTAPASRRLYGRLMSLDRGAAARSVTRRGGRVADGRLRGGGGDGCRSGCSLRWRSAPSTAFGRWSTTAPGWVAVGRRPVLPDRRLGGRAAARADRDGIEAVVIVAHSYGGFVAALVSATDARVAGSSGSTPISWGSSMTRKSSGCSPRTAAVRGAQGRRRSRRGCRSRRSGPIPRRSVASGRWSYRSSCRSSTSSPRRPGSTPRRRSRRCAGSTRRSSPRPRPWAVLGEGSGHHVLCDRPYVVREAVGGRRARQNSVSSVDGGSIAPVTGIPASSSKPRKIAALRGAKSSGCC